MANPRNLDLTADVSYPVFMGIVELAVCVPKAWSVERVEEDANTNCPTGLDHGWKVVESDPTVEDGNTRVQCEDSPDRVHLLLTC